MKQLPHFNFEDEERIFWLEHDSCDYFDLSKAVLIDQKRDMPFIINKAFKSLRIYNPIEFIGNTFLLSAQNFTNIIFESFVYFKETSFATLPDFTLT